MVIFKRIIIFLQIGLFCFCTGSQEESVVKPSTASKNEDIIVKALLYMDWADLPTIFNSSYSDKRELLISHMEDKSATPLNILESKSDNDLAWGTFSYKFLYDYGYDSQMLTKLTIDDYRNKIIDLNYANKAGYSKDFKTLSTAKNLITAYGWWFTNNVSTKTIIEKLNKVDDGNPVFGLKDNKGTTMDVLRIIKADEEFKYLGVSHAMVSDAHFKLYLSGSNDLFTWTQITELGDKAHQGDIEKWGNGYVVVNEQDLTQGSNNIQVRFYNSYADLIKNNAKYDKSLLRSFAPTAEGTPDIQEIEGTSPDQSYILIGFHYYENIIHDQQAFGILNNFNSWKAWIDVVTNHNVQDMGFMGNIGARNGFKIKEEYVTLEAQIASHDWSSWRILFGNGAFYHQLNQQTPLAATSFANPGISQLDLNNFVVTNFLPSQGNKPSESGELLYTFQTN